MKKSTATLLLLTAMSFSYADEINQSKIECSPTKGYGTFKLGNYNYSTANISRIDDPVYDKIYQTWSYSVWFNGITSQSFRFTSASEEEVRNEFAIVMEKFNCYR